MLFSEIHSQGSEFDAVSSIQHQQRGMVGINVMGRGEILLSGGPCKSVSDPVAAIKMHYGKNEQYNGQAGNIISREEESWRGISYLLHNLLPEYSAILISVTLILLFGELLDFMLGKGRAALFHRAKLKTLVALHANEAGKGGELSGKETTIISGALELTEKTARNAMTPVSKIFDVNITARLDRALLYSILENGHSRMPVYHEQPRNIIGLILVKSLLAINPADEVPIKNITIRRIPRKEQLKIILMACPNISSGESVILRNKIGRFKNLLVE